MQEIFREQCQTVLSYERAAYILVVVKNVSYHRIAQGLTGALQFHSAHTISFA